jgi:hypothetical protein
MTEGAGIKAATCLTGEIGVRIYLSAPTVYLAAGSWSESSRLTEDAQI